MSTDIANSFEFRMKDRLANVLSRFWKLLCSVKVRRHKRALELCETLPLGEKRLLAIVECDGHRLLVGATADSISLLLRLSGGRKEKSDRGSAEEIISTSGLVQ